MISSQNILVTGGHGYLATSLISKLQKHNNITLHEFDVRDYYIHYELTKFNMVLHFASPSDQLEFQDSCKTSSTIIKGTINIIISYTIRFLN